MLKVVQHEGEIHINRKNLNCQQHKKYWMKIG